MRYQRRIAEDGRIWERRAALYVELLEHQRPYVASADMAPEEHRYFGPRDPEEQALLPSLTARVDAFASRDVRDQWRVTRLTIHTPGHVHQRNAGSDESHPGGGQARHSTGPGPEGGARQAAGPDPLRVANRPATKVVAASLAQDRTSRTQLATLRRITVHPRGHYSSQ